MKLLLVVPRYNLTNKKDYQYVFPLGLGYISAVLKKNNFDIDCINLNHLDGKIDFLLSRILSKNKYDYILTGHIGIGYAVIEKIINAARKHLSKPKVILGGSLLTSEPSLIFNALKPDFGILGEGEVTILELLKSLENKSDLKNLGGIMFWNENKAITTKMREPIQDINVLPIPDFEGLGFEEKLNNECNNFNSYNLFDYPRTYPLLASRGCPFQCTFCYHTLGVKYRERTIDNIMEELEENLRKYKINIIEIIDDLFSINRERLFEFCKRIKKIIDDLPWECKWQCQLTVNSIDREMLRTLKESGCHAISYGFESYSPDVLKSMKKPITPKQIDNAIKLTMEEGLSIQGNFIFGDTAETKETAKETLDYWKKYCKGQTQIGFIQPYPGSQIYDYCIKKGIIKDKLFFIKHKIAHTNWLNMTENMANQEIDQLKK